MPAAAIELLLDDACDDAVRGLWQRLADAGLPSQAHHRGATNAPHVTVVSTPVLRLDVIAAAARHVAPLLPLSVRVLGATLLGTARRRPLVLALEVPQALGRGVAACLACAPPPDDAAHVRDTTWLPHVTLARRLDADQASRALPLLNPPDHEPPSRITLASLRRWDPLRRTVTEIPDAPC